MNHVLAGPRFKCPGGVAPSVQLFHEITGAPLGDLATPGDVFAQPVFAEGRLFVADEGGRLTAWGP